VRKVYGPSGNLHTDVLKSARSVDRADRPDDGGESAPASSQKIGRVGQN
jgi:hypothetical protein